MVLELAACGSLAAGNVWLLYRCLFARHYYAWQLESAEDIQAMVLPSFRCPISQEVMREPVVTSDGQTYERCNIEEWFRQGSCTSPLTNLSLRSKELVPNLALRQAVADFATKVCPLFRQELEKRRLSEKTAEEARKREADSQKESVALAEKGEEAMEALRSTLAQCEAEIAALRQEKEEAAQELRQQRSNQEQALQLALARQRDEFEKAAELAQAASELSLSKSKAEADGLRRQRDNAVRIIQGLRKSSMSEPCWASAPRVPVELVEEAAPRATSTEAEVEVAEPEEEIVLELEGRSTGPFTSASPEEQTPAEKPSPDISPSASSPEDKEVSASSGGGSWKPPKARLGQLRNLFRRPSGAGHAGVTKSPLNS